MQVATHLELLSLSVDEGVGTHARLRRLEQGYMVAGIRNISCVCAGKHMHPSFVKGTYMWVGRPRRDTVKDLALSFLRERCLSA